MKILLFLITSLIIVGTAVAMPIKPSKSKSMQCRPGQICAMVCNKDDGISYSLYESVHYNSIDNFFNRIIHDEANVSLDAQTQTVADKLGNSDPNLRNDFNKNVKILTAANGFILTQRKRTPSLPEENKCIAEKLAGYRHDLQKFVVDKNIYGHFNSTDRAGLISRMALLTIAIARNVGPEQLVNIERLNRYLLISEADVKIQAKSRNKPAPTIAQLQQGIDYRVRLIFAAASADATTKQFIVMKPIPNVLFRNSQPANQTPVETVATNNITPPPSPIIPGSDIVQPPGSGYEVPKLVGLPPEVAAQANDMSYAANNGAPVQIQPEVQTENPFVPPPGTEIDPNTNNSVQAQPNQEAQPALR